MLATSADTWNTILEYVRAHVKPRQYETWFSKIECLEIGDDSVTISTPNSFYQQWMEKHYREVLELAFAEVLHCEKRVVFEAPEETNGKEPAPGTAAGGEEQAGEEPSQHPAGGGGDAKPEQPSTSSPTPKAAPFSKSTPAVPLVKATSGFNPQYTFDHFVVGRSNRLAHAACLAVTENPGHVYNPLFLHGDVGLGKTHLLQAVCFEMSLRKPYIKMVFLPCEDFVNQFISALQKGEPEAFRNRYRSVDLLVIDDIHFLSSKKQLQEEFHNTFNALHDGQRQIVLSSDAPPNDIKDLQTRLVSRFNWGLVAEIEPPEYETKCAIIRRKAKLRGRELPDDVIHHLATGVNSNIRELEGAVLKIVATAALTSQPIDMVLCRTTLREIAGRSSPVTITEIMSIVANYYNIKVSDLQSKKRTQSIVLPRQICMYLGRQLTQLSLAELGGHFGGRDHTTVLYSESQIKKRINNDPDFRALIERFARELKPN